MRAHRLIPGLLVVSALAACNGVLGIEERELVEAEAELSCELYCDTAAANCTADLQQYESREACLAMCQQLPTGTAGDTSTDSVACRLRNAELAAETGEVGDHCPLAGPRGCGDRCANFCAVFVASCGGGRSPSAADVDTCLAFCAGSPSNPEWTPQDDDLRDHDASIECRLWHLANAALAPDVHCGHADGTTKCEVPSGGGAGGGAAIDDHDHGG